MAPLVSSQLSRLICSVLMVSIDFTDLPCGVSLAAGPIGRTAQLKTPRTPFQVARDTRHIVVQSNRKSSCATTELNGRRSITARLYMSAASRTD